MIFKPQINRSGLYVNNVMLRLNRSLKRNPNRNLNRNLTAAAYILTALTLRKPPPFKLVANLNLPSA